MEKRTVIMMVVVGMVMCASFAFAASFQEQLLGKIHWLGQSTVKIEAGDKVIFIDPFQMERRDPADIVLITHPHQDHLSPNDIAKVVKANTVFIAPRNCVAVLEGKLKTTVMVLEPGETTDIGAIKIKAVPAYNVIKTNFHPKSNKWVGYILTVDGVRIYHAGDTERIPEMKEITCDIALLPLGQTYTMNSIKEAADAAIDVKAIIAIPIHYGLYEGKAEDAREFSRLLKDKLTVVIKANE